MKKYLFLIIVLVFAINLFSKVSPSQDEKNKKFLNILDDNLVQTIKMIGAFNKMANKVPSKVKGLGRYRRFLMDVTIETGKLRNDVKTALKKDPDLRQLMIRDMILSLSPQTDIKNKQVTPDDDNYNYHFLDDMQDVLKKRLKTIRKAMIKEETGIKEKGAFTKQYFDFHTKNYVYSLLLDFIKIHTYLDKQNRQVLVDVVKSVNEVALQNSKR